jgi:hypothetical protein
MREVTGLFYSSQLKREQEKPNTELEFSPDSVAIKMHVSDVSRGQSGKLQLLLHLVGMRGTSFIPCQIVSQKASERKLTEVQKDRAPAGVGSERWRYHNYNI